MPTVTPIAASSSGDNELVAAQTGKRIRVIAYKLSFSGTVNAKFRSATTDLTGLIYGVAAKDSDAPHYSEAGLRNPPGQFETAPGEALNLNLSGATAVGGYLVWEPAL